MKDFFAGVIVVAVCLWWLFIVAVFLVMAYVFVFKIAMPLLGLIFTIIGRVLFFR